ncbi:hypothetical protein PNK_2139 [Candidatus Protochlamydia naegleriophila]|uniref:USP domain-containing protein n=1 Tax=Candidatus Protochlamydia naegleriophila TaxID=389348 RepID=A0A0U5JDZ9_9BACT|nr:hypothetical protein [Candidatus Protochlamydia naegleriophila]CUI17742.1 hypothetical protein PNK_2139 [Candidatus Protochlamydia naegleriophila]
MMQVILSPFIHSYHVFSAACNSLRERINLLFQRQDFVLLNGFELLPVDRFQPPGSIPNGGNTCYMALVLQDLAASDAYNEMFNRPLNRQAGESLSHFQQRKLLQNAFCQSLQKLRQGVNLSLGEVRELKDRLGALGWNQTSRFAKILERVFPLLFSAPPCDSLEFYHFLRLLLEEEDFTIGSETCGGFYQMWPDPETAPPIGHLRLTLDNLPLREVQDITLLVARDEALRESLEQNKALPTLWKVDILRTTVGNNGGVNYEQHPVDLKESLELGEDRAPLRLMQIQCNRESFAGMRHSYLYRRIETTLGTDKWLKCDDDCITEVPFDEIKRREASYCWGLVFEA